MNLDTVSLLCALLALLALAGIAIALILAIGARGSDRMHGWAEAAREVVGPSALWLGFAVAAVCMAGSLWFSESAGFPPCRLCWYQRICMYPLVPLLGVAAARRDQGIRPYAATLAGIGSLISTYHVLVERFPDLESSTCDPANPCSLIWFERFGFLTLPAMALTGFAAILVLMAVARPAPVVTEA